VLASIKRWGIFVLMSVFLVPFVVFLGGWLLAGPYQGNFGVLGLMSTMYMDALRGSISAWVLLTGPVLLVLIWYGCLWLRRVINARMAPVAGN